MQSIPWLIAGHVGGRRRWAAGVALALCFTAVLAATFLLYRPGLSGPFLLDDEANILPAWEHLDSPGAFLHAIAGNTSGPLGRPLSVVTLVATGYLSGHDSYAYKLTNLYIHLLNGILLFWLTARLWASIHPRDGRLRGGRGGWFALAVMALWLLHPLNVSTTLYPVQRMAQMSTLGVVLCVITYLYGRDYLVRDRHRAYAFLLLYGGVPTWMAFAILSKENGALAAPLLLMTEAVVRAATAKARPPLVPTKEIRLGLLLFGALPVGLGILYFMVHWGRYAATYAMRDFSLDERLLSELHILFGYLRNLLFPRLGEMSLFQDDHPIVHALGVREVLLAGLYGLLILTAWRWRGRQPLAAFGLLWFFIGHSMESTVLPLELAFEHRNYLPSQGLFIALASLGLVVYAYIPTGSLRKAARLAVPAYLLLFATLTGIRADTWGNGPLFYRLAMDRHPLSPRLIPHRARALLARNDPEGALNELERGARLEPRRSGYLVAMMLVECFSPRADSARAEGFMRRAIARIRAYPASPYDIMGLKKAEEVTWEERCEGLLGPKQYLALTSAAISHPQPNEALLHYLHAIALYLDHRPEAALAEMKQTLEITDPVNRGKLLDAIANIQLNLGDKVGLKETIFTNASLPVWWRSPYLKIGNTPSEHGYPHHAAGPGEREKGLARQAGSPLGGDIPPPASPEDRVKPAESP